MHRFRLVVIVVIIVLLAGVVAAVYGANRYLASHDHPSISAVIACRSTHQAHSVVIQQGKVMPVHTHAARCDTLTITNDDATDRLVAFGQHDHHTPYDGVTDKLLLKGQSLRVTLNQAGTFLFHDHLHDEVAGDFTVSP